MRNSSKVKEAKAKEVWKKLFPPPCFGNYIAPIKKYNKCQDGCEWELECNTKWLNDRGIEP